MSDITTQAWPEFYTAGGTLKLTAPCYVERAADKELPKAIGRHQFCYILTPRQMGKSSLMVRTKQRLEKVGVRSVIIDLTSIGTTQISVEQWYLGQLQRIVTQLHMQTDYVHWWQQQSHLGVVQRFINFLSEIVLKEIVEPIVIFVDEIDTILSLPKTFNTDDYFAAIRALYNERPINQSLERLSFVLLGVVSPSDLIKAANRTPFNIGTRIHLTDFTLEEAKPLLSALAPNSDIAEQLLGQILFLTGGHPYLTQKTCMRVAKWAQSKWNPTLAPVIVDELVKDMFFSEVGRNTDDNLQFIRKRILESRAATTLLQFYKRVRSRETLPDSELDPILVALKLSGLIKANNDGILIIRNPIYERVFDKAWIDEALAERTALSESETPLADEAEIRYDAYISYSASDRSWVEGYLVPHLQAAGLKLWIDVKGLRAGDNWLLEIEKATTQSRNMLIVLSPHSVASEWTEQESRLFLSLDPKGDQRRLIPLLLKRTEIPPYLRTRTWLDFTQEEYWESAMKQLLSALGASQPADLSEIPASASTKPKPKRYDTAAIRRLLDEAFEDEDLNTFMYDYLRPLYQHFDPNMTKKQKIQSIIEYAESEKLFERLLDSVAKERRLHYRQFANSLEIEGDE